MRTFLEFGCIGVLIRLFFPCNENRKYSSLFCGRVLMTSLYLGVALLLHILSASSGFAQPPVIETVSPSSAGIGETRSVTITLSGEMLPPQIDTAAIGIVSITGPAYSQATGEISAEFNFHGESTGYKDVVVTFTTPNGTETLTKENGFFIGATGSLTITILPQEAVTAGAKWNVDSGTFQTSGATVTGLAQGDHIVRFIPVAGWNPPDDMVVSISGETTREATYTVSTNTLTYPVVDTGQDFCSSDSEIIPCPSPGEPFYGQDAQHPGYQFSYQDNGDGTVSDLVTGLMWQKTIDTDGDGDIDADDKKTHTESRAYCENLTLGGYSDWRLPHIKELYSLIDFRGTDPSGYEGTDTSGLTPFIDDSVFDFNWGDTEANPPERLIDAQYASDTLYVDTAANNGSTLFGVNFADGRIKGYGLSAFNNEKTFYCQCVRENPAYGTNDFTDNGDGTITDNATGLMWSQNDNGQGVNWEDALAWVASQNTANYLGYNDWRMPSAKELQSIVDYERSPGTHSTAAIDPLFNATRITNEAGQDDYPYYWAGTTHYKYNGAADQAVYVAFGRAIGDYGNGWVDVHGAGAQRSDPKAPEPGVTYPNSYGPQGDSQRVYNYVRLVRDADAGTETGTLTVTIEPAEAVAQGAKWSIDSGVTWKDSGTSVTLDAGIAYTVTFKSITGFDSPEDVSGTIAGGANTVNRMYTASCTYSLSDIINLLNILTAGNDPGAWEDPVSDEKAEMKDVLFILQCLAGLRG